MSEDAQDSTRVGQADEVPRKAVLKRMAYQAGLGVAAFLALAAFGAVLLILSYLFGALLTMPMSLNVDGNVHAPRFLAGFIGLIIFANFAHGLSQWYSQAAEEVRESRSTD